MPSYILWVTPQSFAKWKTLFRYISVVSLVSIAFVVVKIKKFLYWFNIHEMAPSWVFWALTTSNYFYLAEILTRGCLPTRQTQCLKNPSKLWIFAQMECTQIFAVLVHFRSNLPPENQRYCLKPNFLQKLHP